MDTQINLRSFIRDIPDWPKPGILFRDITPLLGNPQAFAMSIDQLKEAFSAKKVDKVAAVEARGFIFGAVVAQKLGVGFVPIRKKGKLPFDCHEVTYDLEYGQDTIQVHCDAVQEGMDVLMVDDLLATGGTMAAACELIEKIGGTIAGVGFVIELGFLAGREKLKRYDVQSLICY